MRCPEAHSTCFTLCLSDSCDEFGNRQAPPPHHQLQRSNACPSALSSTPAHPSRACCSPSTPASACMPVVIFESQAAPDSFWCCVRRRGYHTTRWLLPHLKDHTIGATTKHRCKTNKSLGRCSDLARRQPDNGILIMAYFCECCRLLPRFPSARREWCCRLSRLAASSSSHPG